MCFNARLRIALPFLLALTIILAACSPAIQPEPDREDAATAPVLATNTGAPMETAVAPAETAPAGDGLEEINSEQFGFVLAYPGEFDVDNSIYHTFVFMTKRTDLGHRARAFLSVELAGDQTVEWFADQVKKESFVPGIEITTSTTEIGGQKAVILSGVTGQDPNRQVFIVDKGNLYHLTFIPDNPRSTEPTDRAAYQEMENLYGTIITSMRFLPERLEVPPVLSTYNMAYQVEQALEIRSRDDIHRMLGDEFLLLEWLNPGVTLNRLGRGDAVDAIMNNLDPKSPNLVFTGEVNWLDVAGSPEAFTGFFPNESVFPIRVQGWGQQGNDEAVIILERRMDGSFFLRGVLVADGFFNQ